MASRRLALIGTSKGPWICTERIHEPRLRVSGLTEGSILVHTRQAQENDCHTLEGNGVHVLANSPWMRVELTHPSRSVICEIIAKDKVA